MVYRKWSNLAGNIHTHTYTYAKTNIITRTHVLANSYFSMLLKHMPVYCTYKKIYNVRKLVLYNRRDYV